ncbi:hypothetical protein [Pseudoneobacillus sp. C159]
MRSLPLIQSIINTETLQKASLAYLRPGQLLYGRIEKSLANGTAIIQIGNMRLFAQLQAVLSDTESYWFQVQTDNDGGIELKVLETFEQTNTSHLFLKNLQLPETKQNRQLVQFFQLKNLPITPEQLSLAASWIGQKKDIRKELTALEWMINRNLPFTKQTFQSLVAVQEPQSLYQQLEKLGRYLDQHSLGTSTTLPPLKQMIASILENRSYDELDTGKTFQHMLKSLVGSLGLEYEKNVQVWANDRQQSAEPLNSLKPLLMKAIAELGSVGKELEPILNRITGMQIISQDPMSSLHQMVMQLPLSLGGKQSDITLQWNGRKNNKGQIDPDYCRIFMYIDLQSIKQTVIDMQIQKKLIHLSVINENKEIEPIVKALTPTLRAKLKTIGYTLSFAKVSPPIIKTQVDQQQLNPINLSKELYQGVDIKV